MQIELVGVCKSFGEPPKKVLDSLGLVLQPGINCLMGPSGIGKTTLANILAGLVVPDSGDISVRTGMAAVELPDLKVSCVFQEDRLFGFLSALSNVLFVCKERKKNRSRAVELLDRAGLSDSLNKKAKELSGGMKRRVCICRALIADYDLLILDEPFKGLDDGLKPRIMELVLDSFRKESGKIALCITHDLSEADFLGGQRLEL